MKARGPRLLSVIELGTTSIRMVIGQVASGQMSVIEEFEHAVSLGRDTLTHGRIQPETTERCVTALRSFRRGLDELGVEEKNVRIVATSAVREAANRDIFLDRILVATGFEVDVIDQAEVSRLTYRAVQPKLRTEPFFRISDVLVVEVGGGSTETLLFRKGKVDAAHLYRLGALRLRTVLEHEEIPESRLEEHLNIEVNQTLTQVDQNITPLSSPQMVLLGADARFACARICASQNLQSPCALPLKELRKFMWRIVTKTVDEVAKEYKLNYTEAETLGPALFIAVALAERLKLKRVMVGEVTLRTGILAEMVTGEKWTAEFRRQVINSATAVAKKYDVDLRHARHVAHYSQQLIETLRARYPFAERDEVILHVACLLHEVGQAINSASHHKHSRYLILNSDIFGLGKRDIAMAALVARYHRRAIPKPSHDDYMALDRTDRITVSKLAAIIRVASALDHLHARKCMKIDMSIEDSKRLVLTSGPENDIGPLQRRVSERGALFTSIYGKEILLRTKRT